MNWLGAGLLSMLAALFGALVGGIVHFEAFRAGLHCAPLAGAITGLVTALCSREKNVLRGIVVGSLGAWSAAVSEALAAPREGLVRDVLHFSERLHGADVVAYVACILAGLALASRGWSLAGLFEPAPHSVRPERARRE